MMQQYLENLLAGFAATRLTKFRNRHRGEACYVFGDGPSVKWFDLSGFQDLPAICCGMLPFHRDAHKLDLRYCVLLEPWAFTPEFVHARVSGLKNFSAVLAEYRAAIRQNRQKEFFVHITNYPSLTGKNISYVFRRLPDTSDAAQPQLRQFDVFAGSFHGSLALAWYMGFTKIYLIGFDAWTVQPARNMHWYEHGRGILFEAENLAEDFLDVIRNRRPGTDDDHVAVMAYQRRPERGLAARDAVGDVGRDLRVPNDVYDFRGRLACGLRSLGGEAVPLTIDQVQVKPAKHLAG